MAVGPHVFGDDRFGLWVIESSSLTDKLRDRLPKIKAFAGGAVTDIFLPESAVRADRDLVRGSDLFPATWTTPANRGPVRYAQESLAAMDRQGTQVLELNIETPGNQQDSWLTTYIPRVVNEIRVTRKNLRLRVNMAPFKAQFLSASYFNADMNLYLLMQAYFGNMDGRASEADVLMDMIDSGHNPQKCSVMYGAANYDPFVQPQPSVRERTLPAMTIRRLRRGSIFSDDLMAEVGLL